MNKKILTPLFVLASFLLIGCSADKIVARPDWINEDIVDGDLKDNKMKEIYDAIKELGDTNSNVLNKVMYDIAQNQLGHFEDVKNDKGEIIEYGIKSIATKDTITDSEINEFVNKYSVYKSEDKAYKLTNLDPKARKVDEIDISKSDHDKATISKNKIINQYNRIIDSVYESLYNDIKGGEYSSKIDNLFQEEYFVQHLYKEMYYKDFPEDDPTDFVVDRVFIPKTSKQSWKEYVNATNKARGNSGFLQVVDENNDFTKYYKDYIARKVLPEVYRTLLIENYVKEQRYTNLGRSYARKVKMISIPTNSESYINGNIRNMLYTFANDVIKAGAWDADNDCNLENIQYAINGFACSGTDATPQEKAAQELLEQFIDEKDVLMVQIHDGSKKKLTWDIRTDDNGMEVLESSRHTTSAVYKGTKLYDLAEKYIKIMDVDYVGNKFVYQPKSSLTADELTAYNDLTKNGTISVERGLVLKEREIRLNSMVKDGWFLKSGGLTELDESFRDKLFNIRTAKILDDVTDIIKEAPDLDDTVRYFGDTTIDSTTGKYLKRKAFLFDDHDQPIDYKTVVLESKTNFFIVEVEEAGSASKFSQESAQGSYLELKATPTLGDSNDAYDEIVRKVTKEVASGETYKKNAEQYYLMISNIIFYDQSVYDYFKSQFPELFK